MMREATVEPALPVVPAAPSAFSVVSYGPEPDARAVPGECAMHLRDPVNGVEWRIEASQAWTDTVTRGDTTVVRHTAIGDYVPALPRPYGMEPGQVVRIDCATYKLLGLTKPGG